MFFTNRTKTNYTSFFYQLSTIGGLQHFKKKVLLVGSHSDTYSPYHSARIEMCRAALDDLTGAGGDYRRMLENIWKSVDPSLGGQGCFDALRKRAVEFFFTLI